MLHATDVEIGSRLRLHRGGSYVALFEVICSVGFVDGGREESGRGESPGGGGGYSGKAILRSFLSIALHMLTALIFFL